MSFLPRASWLLALLLTACAVEVPLTPSLRPVPAATQAAPLDDDARQAQVLAPTGVLRVGVYPGSPTSLVRGAAGGAPAGVAYELGYLLGQRLQVPVEVVEFKRVAEIIDALKAGQIDMTFTNASPARAQVVDFTRPLVQLELGLLVPPGSPIASFDDLDRAGVRVGVAQGSSSQGKLSTQFKQAKVVPVASLAVARQQLLAHELDVFATNKGILFELGERLPGFQVLPGRWGFEQLAIAIPPGRRAGMPLLQQFADDVVQGGQLRAMAQRAGLRGLAQAE